MECKYCEKEIIKTNPKQNNMKFCNSICSNKWYWKYGGRKEWNEKRKAEKAKIPKAFQCQICGGWYNKLCSHTWNAHKILAYDYKKMFGLETTKGLVTDEYREHKRKLVYEHPEVIENNLVKAGEKTRMKKGHDFNYQRTEATLAKLRVLHKLRYEVKYRSKTKRQD